MQRIAQDGWLFLYSNPSQRAALSDGLRKTYSDGSLYADIKFEPTKNVLINGINFLHPQAIITLVPESVHRQAIGKGSVETRYIPAQGSQDQVDSYIYSGEEGCIYMCLDSRGLVTSDRQAMIDQLFSGFSFDGSACRGPAKLRTLKTLFEAVTNQ